MSSQFFEGAAGTGKTYNLMIRLEALVTDQNLAKHQKVMALTFMHGSRNRLNDALSKLQCLDKRFDCMTFDSFAGHIVNRWRDLLDSIRARTEIPILNSEYEQTCHEASELLKEDSVQRWVSQTYPIVLVDEAQDLTPARLAIMQNLSSCSVLLAAADEYQHLDETHNNNEAVQWLSDNINTARLTQPKRTNDPGLLQVAHTLRSGNGILSLLSEGYRGRKELGSFTILTVPKWQMLSWQAGFALLSNESSHAILTLSNNDQNSNNAINRLKQESQNLNRSRGTTFGPFSNIQQERKSEILADECFVSLHLPNETLSIEYALDQCTSIADIFVKESVYRWIKKRKNLAGQTELEKVDLEKAINEAFQNKRRYQRQQNKARLAMTIHQAKNREFDNVIVLWTYALSSNASSEYKRRLLYNAITRAKISCTVVVLGERRLTSPPFSD